MDTRSKKTPLAKWREHTTADATDESFITVKAQADKLKSILGPSWQVVMWPTFVWNYKVVLRKGDHELAQLHPPLLSDDKYMCVVDVSPQIIAYDMDPKLAVQKAVSRLNGHIASLQISRDAMIGTPYNSNLGVSL